MKHKLYFTNPEKTVHFSTYEAGLEAKIVAVEANKKKDVRVRLMLRSDGSFSLVIKEPREVETKPAENTNG